MTTLPNAQNGISWAYIHSDRVERVEQHVQFHAVDKTVAVKVEEIERMHREAMDENASAIEVINNKHGVAMQAINVLLLTLDVTRIFTLYCDLMGHCLCNRRRRWGNTVKRIVIELRALQ